MKTDFTADIAGPTADFPAGSRSPDFLDSLTDEQMDYLRSTLPTEEEVMIGWATHVLAASEIERRILISAQVQVLDGLSADPSAWCRDALLLARRNHA